MPSDKLHVSFCGVDCASPIGVGAVGEHWGTVEKDPVKFGEVNGNILVKHAKAGAGFILMNGMFLDDDALQAICLPPAA